MKYIDISVPLSQDVPHWPGSIGFSRIQTEEEGSGIRNSVISCDVHAGTHIDAPAHHLPNGTTINDLPLDLLIGMATIIDVGDAPNITKVLLERSEIPHDVKRLLIKTSNSMLWKTAGNHFVKTFVGIKPDAAEWIVSRGICLVGIDYLSIQCFDDGPKTHTILLGAGVIIVEGLDLTAVGPGQYHVICLPLNITGSEGAPARAVVCPINAGENI